MVGYPGVYEKEGANVRAFVGRIFKLFKVYTIVSLMGTVIAFNYYMRPVFTSNLPFFKNAPQSFHNLEQYIFVTAVTLSMTLVVLKALLLEVQTVYIMWLRLMVELKLRKKPDELPYLRPQPLEHIHSIDE